MCSLVLEGIGKIFLYKFTELGVSRFSGDKANYHVPVWSRLSSPNYKFGETSIFLDTKDGFIYYYFCLCLKVFLLYPLFDKIRLEFKTYADLAQW